MTKSGWTNLISLMLALLLACGLFWLGAWLITPKDTVDWIDLGFRSFQFSFGLWLILVYTGILPVVKNVPPILSVLWSTLGGMWMSTTVLFFAKNMGLSNDGQWILIGASVLFLVLIGAYALYARKKQIAAAEKDKTE